MEAELILPGAKNNYFKSLSVSNQWKTLQLTWSRYTVQNYCHFSPLTYLVPVGSLLGNTKHLMLWLLYVQILLAENKIYKLARYHLKHKLIDISFCFIKQYRLCFQHDVSSIFMFPKQLWWRTRSCIPWKPNPWCRCCKHNVLEFELLKMPYPFLFIYVTH